MPVPNPVTKISNGSSCIELSRAQKQQHQKYCLSFNIKVLFKGKYNLPWMKVGSQTTKHAAIRILWWQYIAVLRDTVVLSPFRISLELFYH